MIVKVDVPSTWNNAPCTLISGIGAFGASANGVKPSGSTTFWVTPATCSDDPLTVKGALALFTKVPHVPAHKLFVIESVLVSLPNTPKASAFRFNDDPLFKLKSVPLAIVNELLSFNEKRKHIVRGDILGLGFFTGRFFGELPCFYTCFIL